MLSRYSDVRLMQRIPIKMIFYVGVKMIRLENYADPKKLLFSNPDETSTKKTEFVYINPTKEM